MLRLGTTAAVSGRRAAGPFWAAAVPPRLYRGVSSAPSGSGDGGGVSGSSATGISVTGMLCGILQASAGVGGNIAMVSGLVRFAKLEQIVAAGTSMPTQIVAQGVGLATVLAADASLVHLPTTLCLAVPALGGIVAGVRLGTLMSDTALKLAFAALVLALVPPVASRTVKVHEANRLKRAEAASSAAAVVTGAATTATGAAAASVSTPPATESALSPSAVSASSSSGGTASLMDNWQWPEHVALHCVCGTGVGVLSGAVGVGGGPLIVAFLAALPAVSSWLSPETGQSVAVEAATSPSTAARGGRGALGPSSSSRTPAPGVSPRQVGPTTNAVLLPMMMIGTLTHWRLGSVRWGMLPRLCGFTALGAMLGGVAAVQAPEEMLMGGVTCFLLFTGVVTGRASLAKLLAKRYMQH